LAVLVLVAGPQQCPVRQFAPADLPPAVPAAPLPLRPVAGSVGRKHQLYQRWWIVIAAQVIVVVDLWRSRWWQARPRPPDDAKPVQFEATAASTEPAPATTAIGGQ